MSKQLLLVEDDPNLGSVLKEYLEIKGYDVSHAENGKLGWEKFITNHYDFIMLDVMMPVMDGMELGAEIRKKNTDVPILYLTAKSMKEDKIKAFELGADDYLTKPFSMEELILRIEAIMKRTNKSINELEAQNEFTIGAYEFDYTRQILKNSGGEKKLTTKEAELLKMLCMHMNNVMKREDALVKIWGDDNYFTARSMDVFITKLRKYLKEDSNINIMNIHGSGYKLVV